MLLRCLILVPCTFMVKVLSSRTKAFEYYEQAADLGDADAQTDVGTMYYNGQAVVKDTTKAREWWTTKKAATQGNKNALKYLKQFFANK